MQNADWWVDHAAHRLHHADRAFPCDRDVEALATWNGHALLLSSDTDCLSLWDGEGMIRTVRVGVYPQDMAVHGDVVCVCGGADGRLHMLSLPELYAVVDFPLPGMPERVALREDEAYVLTLLAEPEMHTALLHLDLQTGDTCEMACFPGLPGAVAADDSGVWLGVSELICHIPKGQPSPDVTVEGVGLARRIEVMGTGIVVDDALEERRVFIRT